MSDQGMDSEEISEELTKSLGEKVKQTTIMAWLAHYTRGTYDA